MGDGIWMDETSEEAAMGDGIWMDEGEARSWREGKAALEASRAAKTDPKSAKKPTAHKLNLALLEACSAGEARDAMKLLELGAQINCRARGRPGNTPFSTAVQAGHDELALDLLRKGGLPAPPMGYGGEDAQKVKQFEVERDAGAFSSAMRRELSARAVDLMVQHASSWRSVAMARDELPLARTTRPDAAIMGACMAWRRYDLVLEGVESGVPASLAHWREAKKSSGFKYGDTLEIEHRAGLLGLLRVPAAAASMDGALCADLFDAAARCEDAELLETLLDAGMRPNALWSVHVEGSRRAWSVQAEHKAADTQTLLVAVAAGDSAACFDLVKSCPPAVAAARAQPQTPGTLARVPVGRLLDMGEWGVPIGALDAKGHNVTHLWALIDREPRSGWASVGARAPELFEAKDKGGKTGYQRMADKLTGKAQDEFLSSLARVEKREIRKEIGASAPLPSAQKRTRL